MVQGGHLLTILVLLPDIDECEENVVCDQVCVNTNGSYYCDCEAGYNLRNDNITCEGKVQIVSL